MGFLDRFRKSSRKHGTLDTDETTSEPQPLHEEDRDYGVDEIASAVTVAFLDGQIDESTAVNRALDLVPGLHPGEWRHPMMVFGVTRNYFGPLFRRVQQHPDSFAGFANDVTDFDGQFFPLKLGGTPDFIPGADGMPAIVACLEHEDTRAQEAARLALEKLKDRFEDSPEIDDGPGWLEWFELQILSHTDLDAYLERKLGRPPYNRT